MVRAHDPYFHFTEAGYEVEVFGPYGGGLCHGTAILRYARLSGGEPIVSGAETAQLVIESLGR